MAGRVRKSSKRQSRKSEVADDAAPAASQQPAGPRELIVSMHQDAMVRTRHGEVAAAAPRLADPLIDALGGVLLRPLFGATEERVAAASAAVPGAPDLSTFYLCEAPDEDLDALAESLRGVDAVRSAYVKPPSEPATAPAINDMVALPDAPPVTPDFTANQVYLEVAPGGIDARHAWTRTGGKGTGVRVIDIEGAWRFSHEDLQQNQGGVVGGTQSDDLRWRDHGTAVIGVIGSDENAVGTTGIAPLANVSAISIFGGVGSAKAIRDAADRLAPGDIILIELHRPGPRHNFQSRDDQRGIHRRRVVGGRLRRHPVRDGEGRDRRRGGRQRWREPRRSPLRHPTR